MKLSMMNDLNDFITFSLVYFIFIGISPYAMSFMCDISATIVHFSSVQFISFFTFSHIQIIAKTRLH